MFLEEVLRYIFRLERDLFAATQSHPRHGSEWTDAIEDAEAKVTAGWIADERPWGLEVARGREARDTGRTM